MAPIVSRVSPSKLTGTPLGPPRNLTWERLRERPTYKTEDSQFTLTFRLRTDPKLVTFVAFTYPYTCLLYTSPSPRD